MAVPRTWVLSAVAAFTLLLAGCGTVPQAGSSPALPTASGAPVTVSPDAPGPAPAEATPTATPTPEAPDPGGTLAGRVIVVDPGHNGRYRSSFNTQQVDAGNGRTKACNTSGTESATGYAEHAYNWDQAGALADELRARGASVVLTREDDDGLGPCVNQRAQVANDHDADALVSLHADGNNASGARGFHIIVSTAMAGGPGVEASSKALAERVRDALEAGTAMPRSTYIGGGSGLSPRTDIATLNLLATSPGVMVEMGNMRNATDAGMLASASFRRSAAVAIADALESSLANTGG